MNPMMSCKTGRMGYSYRRDEMDAFKSLTDGRRPSRSHLDKGAKKAR